MKRKKCTGCLCGLWISRTYMFKSLRMVVVVVVVVGVVEWQWWKKHLFETESRVADDDGR